MRLNTYIGDKTLKFFFFFKFQCSQFYPLKFIFGHQNYIFKCLFVFYIKLLGNFNFEVN